MMENLSEASCDGRVVFSAPSSDQKRFHFRFVVSCLVVGIAAAIAFTLYSNVDLAVAGWFREDDGVFVFQRGIGRIARKFFMWGFAAAVVLSVVGAFRGFWLERATFGLPALAWAYLIACFIAGH